MRTIPVLMTLLFLAGCEANSFWPALPFSGEPDRMAIAAAESGEIEPDAQQIRFRIGRRQATAVLIQRQGERRMWRAPGGVVVATDGARVVATAGLPQIVTGTRFDGPDPLEDPRALLDRSAEARRLVDVSGASRDPASMRFGLAFDCRLRADRTEDNDIVVVERCRVPGQSTVTNRFWADENGRIGYAEQWAGPGMGLLALDFD
ncbi:YjbF family lipoprotein [Roseococcus sp. YIM B11640]|uniref:YjbF family lipoprotein n=1 Tax=Roseococcus sp. YIM B11640 TaxID=3133973 RepID=UPI003C79F6E7